MKDPISAAIKISALLYSIALLFSFLFAQIAVGQNKRLTGIQVSYLGEMITHPGVKVGVDYNLRSWSKVKAEGKKRERTLSKSVVLSPTLGSFYHKRYQTGFFIVPELKYYRENQKGVFYDVGVGLGYLRTVIPNVYEVTSSGELNKVNVGYNYFSSLWFFTLGKSVKKENSKSFSLFVKPQLMYAVPNFYYGTGYFFLELGVNFKIKSA